MPSLVSSRRIDPEIALHATVAVNDPNAAPLTPPELPRVSWLVSALGGAGVALVLGWLVLTGLTVLAWVGADSGSFAEAMNVGTQLWLLSNGAGAELGATTVTLIPWGATLACGYAVSRLAVFAARQARGTPLLTAARVTGVMTLGYVGPVAVVAMILNGSASAPGLLAVLVLVALAACWGSCRGLGYRPSRRWPTWCRTLPRAILAGQLVLLLLGAAALVSGVLAHLDRVLTLTDGLHPGVLGGVALALAQLAYVPNALVWAASYALGAGFTLGPGSLVSPAATHYGLLPSVPLLGAVPAAGPGAATGLWWLTGGVVAGGLAALLTLRARPVARFDQTALVGGLAGLVTGVLFVGLAWASGGDLGSLRLTGLGPRLLPLLILGAVTLGLAGMLVGLVFGLLRRHSG